MSDRYFLFYHIQIIKKLHLLQMVNQQSKTNKIIFNDDKYSVRLVYRKKSPKRL